MNFLDFINEYDRDRGNKPYYSGKSYKSSYEDDDAFAPILSAQKVKDLPDLVQKEVKKKVFPTLMAKDTTTYKYATPEYIDNLDVDIVGKSLEISSEDGKVGSIPVKDLEDLVKDSYHKSKFEGSGTYQITFRPYVTHKSQERDVRRYTGSNVSIIRKISAEEYKKLKSNNEIAATIKPAKEDSEAPDIYYLEIPVRATKGMVKHKRIKYYTTLKKSEYDKIPDDLKKDISLTQVPVDDIADKGVGAVFIDKIRLGEYEKLYNAKKSRKKRRDFKQQSDTEKSKNLLSREYIGSYFSRMLDAYKQMGRSFSIEDIKKFKTAMNSFITRLNKYEAPEEDKNKLVDKYGPDLAPEAIKGFFSKILRQAYDDPNKFEETIKTLMDKASKKKDGSKVDPKEKPEKMEKPVKKSSKSNNKEKEVEKEETPKVDDKKVSSFLDKNKNVINDIDTELEKVTDKSLDSDTRDSSQKKASSLIQTLINTMAKEFDNIESAKEAMKKILQMPNLGKAFKDQVPSEFSRTFSNLSEESATGTGAAVSSGEGEGVATKYAFDGAGGTKAKRKKGIMKDISIVRMMKEAEGDVTISQLPSGSDDISKSKKVFELLKNQALSFTVAEAIENPEELESFLEKVDLAQTKIGKVRDRYDSDQTEKEYEQLDDIYNGIVALWNMMEDVSDLAKTISKSSFAINYNK